MKKHWLRGILLGLSLALLLTGGVALAQSLTVEPECFQCWPGTRGDFQRSQPGYPYSYIWDSCGWAPGALVHYTERFLATDQLLVSDDRPADEDGCLSNDNPWGWSCDGEALHHRSQASAEQHRFPDDYWGVMRVCLESEGNADAAASARVCQHVLFAEACEAAEFVPEPGTIALLGSGLAGLAGYATLRWKARK